MHPYVLISLLSTLAAGMLAGAIWARDSANRGNQLAALLLAGAAFWSLCDVLSNAAHDPVVALEFVRWSCLGSIMMGPLAFHMLLTLEPKLRRRYERWLGFAYGSALLFVFVAVTTPAMWTGVVPTPWGWAGTVGAGVAVSWAVVIPLPFAALADWIRLSRRSETFDTWLGIAVAIPALIATLTDFVLPMLGTPFPRLGSVSVVLWGGIALWKVYRFRDPILAPHLYAGEILATLPDGVALLRLDETIRAANARMAALIGLPAADLVGRPIADFLTAEGRDGRAGEGRPERQLLQASGDIVAVAVDEAGLYDKDGDALGSVVVVRDLREVVSLRSRLVTSGRLAAVGQLAAGIAHEINNPIAYIQSGINLLDDHWRAVATASEKSDFGPELDQVLREGREMIAESREGLARVAAIVRDVGGFSRDSEPEWTSADVNELLETAIRVANPQLRQRATVVRDYAELPLVQCVAQELMQVFLNLLLNASQSLASPGEIRISTRCEAETVVVIVSDDGEGMSPETRRQIFTPFFTTKPVGVGTGLGLSISHQIVEKHAGTIAVESAPGEGTAFRIVLPLDCSRPHEPGQEPR